MFICLQCQKNFKRKDILSRHIKTVHSGLNKWNYSSDNDNSETNQFENKQATNEIKEQSLLKRDDLSESSYESGNFEKNSTIRHDLSEFSSVDDSTKRNVNNEYISQNNNKNNLSERNERLNPLNQRILAATEVIRTKFNALRKNQNVTHNSDNKTPVPNDQEDQFTRNLPKNCSCLTLFEAKLPELMQSVLDILLIKELENISRDRKNNENKKNGEKLKRLLNSVDEQQSDVEIMSSDEIPPKRFKYDNSLEYEKDNDSSSIGSKECVISKDWYDPSALVDELRKLGTTGTGFQIFGIMKRLSERNNLRHVNRYQPYRKEWDDLILNLNKLKQTEIGQRIYCILRDLKNADIIEHNDYDYATDQKEHNSYKGDEDDNTVDDAENVIAGNVLYSSI